MKMRIPVVSTKDSNPSSQSGKEGFQEQIKTLQAALQSLKSEISDLHKVVSSLNERVSESTGRYIASCPACATQYDMLAHHYSIGLFDNMVYVKCPNCNKTLPVQGGSGGGIRTAIDEAP
jgi:predicted Zn finger-like uncharacterized protein